MGRDPMDGVVTVAVVEDTDVVVEGVRSWIGNDPGRRATVVAVAASIEAILAGPGRDADVIVLDLELGKEMVTSRVGELTAAGHRVVVYSVHAKPFIVETVLAAGASAFMDKHTERGRFVDVVVDVANDRPHVTRSMAGGMLSGVHFSQQEQQALLLLFQGMDHASIARRMAKHGKPGETIRPSTVKQYLERARAKLAAAGKPTKSNVALLARCIELGLIRPDDVSDYRSAAADDD